MPYWDHEGERRKILRLFSFVVFISPPSHVTATGGMGKRLGKTLPLKVGQVQDHVLKKRNYLLVD